MDQDLAGAILDGVEDANEDDNEARGEARGEREPESEIAINATVDATSVLLDLETMSPAVLWAFCIDIAQNILPYDVLATRYGFADWRALGAWLAANAAVKKKIKEIRAVWESDDNVAVRARTLAGHAVLEALPETARVMFNPKVPDSTRLDALKLHARIAGIDGNPHTARENAGQMGGSPGLGRFSVNIMFQNAGRMETITTVEHDREAIEVSGE
jgi:hypothetical protein